MKKTIEEKIIDEIYANTSKEYKSIIKGKPYILFMDDTGRSVLGSVENSPEFIKRYEKMKQNNINIVENGVIMNLILDELSYMVAWSMSSKKENGLDDREDLLVEKLMKALEDPEYENYKDLLTDSP